MNMASYKLCKIKTKKKNSGKDSWDFYKAGSSCNERCQQDSEFTDQYVVSQQLI